MKLGPRDPENISSATLEHYIYHDLASWRQLMLDAGFLELDHYYRPANLPFEQQPWLASIWRKIS